MVTEDVTPDARYALGLVYDHVVDVDKLYVPHKRRQARQDRPYMFTRMNALRLGADGDLGCAYEKMVVLDADVLPLKHYAHLFTLPSPAGILNEDKSHFVETDEAGRYVIPESVDQTGTWKWHRLYDDVCPHGAPIPAEITDRIAKDPLNLGINGGLFVFEPSMDEYRSDPGGRAAARDAASGRRSVRLARDAVPDPALVGALDQRRPAFCRVERLPAACRCSMARTLAGSSPGSSSGKRRSRRWGRYADFQSWFRTYSEMVGERLSRLCTGCAG